METETLYNLRLITVGEFDLHVFVMQVFENNGENDEVDVMEFEGDDAVECAEDWIASCGGILGEIG